MRTKLDTNQVLTEEDYGPFLSRVTLYQEDGKYLLVHEEGYSKPYETKTYEFSGTPWFLGRTSLATLIGNGGGPVDQSWLESDLGVTLVKTG